MTPNIQQVAKDLPLQNPFKNYKIYKNLYQIDCKYLKGWNIKDFMWFWYDFTT